MDAEHMRYSPRIRSNFLAHWTGGKDIAQRLPLAGNAREQYVGRIFDTIENGLWLTSPKETVSGYSVGPVQYVAPFVSFTEIRAINIAAHAAKYGLLGFVFERDFVVQRGGGPVFYVNNDDWRVANLKVLRDLVERLGSSNISLRDGASGVSCDELKARLFNSATLLFSQLKSMHETGNDYQCYEEYEWRIPHTHRAEKKELLKKGFYPDTTKQPQYYLPFKIEDLKFLVVPDYGTKDQFLQSSRYTSTFDRLNVLTIEEYGQI